MNVAQNDSIDRVKLNVLNFYSSHFLIVACWKSWQQEAEQEGKYHHKTLQEFSGAFYQTFRYFHPHRFAALMCFATRPVNS